MKPKPKLYPWQESTPAARLAQCFGEYGGTIEGFIAEPNPAILKRHKLKQKDLTDDVIRQAKAIDRQRDAWAKNLTLDMGGSWNGEKRINETAKFDRKILAALKENGPCRLAVVSIEAGLKMSETLRHLRRLRDRKIVKRKNGEYRIAR